MARSACLSSGWSRRRPQSQGEDDGPAAGPQQQAGAGGQPDQLGRHEDGHLPVRAREVAPGPGQQQQRRRHLEAGDGDERVDGVAHERAAGEAGGRHGLRRRPRGRPARQHTLDDAQVLDLLAIGARGQPGAALPRHLLVQRERVRHVADQIVTVVCTHHAPGLPPRRRTEATPRPARGQRRRLFSSYDVYRPKPDGGRSGGASARSTGRRDATARRRAA